MADCHRPLAISPRLSASTTPSTSPPRPASRAPRSRAAETCPRRSTDRRAAGASAESARRIRMSRGSPRSRSRIHCGGSSGWRSRVAENVCKRVTRPPERLSRLLRAELAAVPDDDRLDAACRSFGRQPLDRRAAVLRERTLRVDVRADRVTVMNEEKSHRTLNIFKLETSFR